MLNDPRLWDDYRFEDYTVRVLGDDDRDLGLLDGVREGTIVVSTDARIKRAGKLLVTADKPPSWWGTHRLQVFVTVNGVSWSLGVFIPTTPGETYTGDSVEYEVEIHDKLLIPDQDCVTSAYTVPVGTQLIPHVESMLRDMGQTKINIEPFVKRYDKDGRSYTSGFNTRPLTWDAGESKLTIINDILDYCGYFSLSCDPSGTFVSEHYRIPAEREIAVELVEGSKAIHSTSWEFEQDLAGIPNRVVYVAQSSDDGQGQEVPPLVSTWENLDPESPFLFQGRGRWISEVKTDVEAADQDALDVMVKRRVSNALDPMAKVTIQNAVLPLALNDIVRFKSAGKDMFMSVRRFEYSLTPGSLMSTTLRKVNRDVE